MDLLKDPKFKKGTKMKDLSPNSQEMLKKVRKARNVQNWTAWRNKYASKGVPKSWGADGAAGSSSVGEPVHAEPVPADPYQPLTLKDARATWLQYPFWNATSCMFSLWITFCMVNFLQEKFMKDFLKENKEGTVQEKFKAGNKAWMESEIRARIIAARLGIGSVAPWVGANTCAERAKKDCFKLCSVLILLVSSLFDCFRMSGHKLHQAVRCDCGWVDWFAIWLCCELFKLLISSYLGEPLWT